MRVGGERKRIKHNAIKCLKCGDVVESVARHDFRWCKCRSVAVDGGKDYLKRAGVDWEDRTEWE